MRLEDVHGPGRHQDFPLITSADGPLVHHLLLPAIDGFFGQSYSSVLLYRIGGRLRLVGARPVGRPSARPRGALPELEAAAARGEARFELALAPLAGRWLPVGRLEVGDKLSSAAAERIRLNPWNTGGGIEPTGPLMGLRRSAYRGSQRGRGAG